MPNINQVRSILLNKMMIFVPDLDINTTDSFGNGGGSGGGGGFNKKGNGKKKVNVTKPKLLMSSLKQGRRALAARTKAPVNAHSSIPSSQGEHY